MRISDWSSDLCSSDLASGRIAWQLLGRIPHRVGGCDPTAPVDPMAGCDWDGWAPQPTHVIDPPAHRLWRPTARVVDGEALATIGVLGRASGRESMWPTVSISVGAVSFKKKKPK